MKKMSKNINVYTTSKGKKFHYYLTCSYIKGKAYKKVSLAEALQKTKGSCSYCERIYKKLGGKIDDELNYSQKEEIKENNSNKDMDLNNEINKNIIFNSKNTGNFSSIDDENPLNNKSNNYSKLNISTTSLNSSIKEKNNESVENLFDNNLDEINNNKINITDMDLEIDNELMEDYNKNNNKIIYQINNNDISDNKEEENKNNNISENEEEESKNNNKLSDNEEESKNINNISDNEEENQNNKFINNNDYNNNNKQISKENMKTLNLNLPKKDIDLSGKDFVLLEETNKSAILFMFKDINPVTDSFDQNFSLLYERKINNNNSFKNGNFKFKFDIIPNKELKEPLQISVGFIIKYYEDENIIKKENKKMKSIYGSKTLMKDFMVYEQIKNIFVLLNIINGKFFVVGSDLIDKRNKNIFLCSENSDILYFENLIGIKLQNIKEIRAIFRYDEDDLNFANIFVNGVNLNDYYLKK